jgi:hypothetical protein
MPPDHDCRSDGTAISFGQSVNQGDFLLMARLPDEQPHTRFLYAF